MSDAELREQAEKLRRQLLTDERVLGGAISWLERASDELVEAQTSVPQGLRPENVRHAETTLAFRREELKAAVDAVAKRWKGES